MPMVEMSLSMNMEKKSLENTTAHCRELKSLSQIDHQDKKFNHPGIRRNSSGLFAFYMRKKDRSQIREGEIQGRGTGTKNRRCGTRRCLLGAPAVFL
ncbi:hypothetical protein [Geoalkalibacter halelectricus]|uniref:hypothetical protein n=1 Tax=Geoalkalibacter halelectricus TaxID=2847045 RepID=UPI003D24DBC6